VQALDGAGNASGQSTAAIVTTPATLDTIAPSTPTGLTATAVSLAQINVAWSASTDNVGVTGYRILRNGAPFVDLGNVTTFQDRGLTPSTTYIYTVRALDAAGNVSGISLAASATTQAAPDTVPPSTPTNVVAIAASVSEIGVSWSPSTDNVAVASYRVYRNGVFIATVAVTTYQDSGLSPSTSYSYNVDAIDGDGNVSALSAAANATTLAALDTIAPTAPSGLTASAVSQSQIDLNWTASSDNLAVTGYRVFRNGTLLTTLGNVTAYQDTGLSASTTYSYRVRATDLAGNVSNQSNAASATTQAAADTSAPTTPTGLTANAFSSSRINLSWSASTDNVGVTGYRVYQNGVFLVDVGNVTTYQSAGLAASTIYSYNVDAIDARGNASGISAVASATTLAPNTATLGWDPVTAPNLVGYRIYYGTASGTYLQPVGLGVDVGNVTIHTVTGLSGGTRYFFAATAVYAGNIESVFSIEVFKDIP
jgi:chitodextrinase